jgi:hypothetical protein
MPDTKIDGKTEYRGMVQREKRNPFGYKCGGSENPALPNRVFTH